MCCTGNDSNLRNKPSAVNTSRRVIQQPFIASEEKRIIVGPCRIAKPGIEMSRKVRRVPFTLNSRDVKEIPEDEIRLMLRGADDLIGSGGRGMLAKILKGSRQKALLEHEFDRSPVYGAFSDLSLEQITARIDWLIINGYLRIEYDYRLPILVYTKRGWAIERETYADELLERMNRLLADGDPMQDLRWLTERNPEVLQLIVDKIAATGDPKYLPILKRWQNKATRRVSLHIRNTRRALEPNAA